MMRTSWGKVLMGGDARALPRHSILPDLDPCQSSQESPDTSSQAEDELTGYRRMSPTPPFEAWNSYLYREDGRPGT